ncbi:metal cation transporter, ZIP family protein (macronuclear) [Tetrahymena thermophila SB210]|uniref:Metal cation transporter, ZIP family protein n=1 Tax=Tetrahymena thermophila (strain SB210) TaxID=312017 RepID=Q23QQ9_TETTS|nr:metal cation transporter, ZIP family protein [Tetrahymena thermophila SB210]EAR98829.1 metal cation transporter, ZIP family protein [Tetrahymena thermophila SB210]|eukprot:XP_001019074.1 metal cation transporter, ZIP family protein [Tetrahymena thermophila SB210]
MIDGTIIVKSVAMVIMFLIIVIMGNLPLRVKSFRENKKILSIFSAFSGGLFISIGLIHILPEAGEDFEKYYNSVEHFPFQMFIAVISISFLLFIEKIIGEQFTHHHHHQYNNSNDLESQQQDQQINENCLLPFEIEDDTIISKQSQIKQVFEEIDISLSNQEDNNKSNIITPFVLQIALGIHATLEGLAIGVEQDFSKCLTITLAILVHKWAEGLVLGLALKQSKMNINRATIMVIIQSTMNPLGICIGWGLSGNGYLINGILMSISAGTFIYIATQEIIAQEFNKNRYQVCKFFFFLIGVGFISSLYFIEQATNS